MTDLTQVSLEQLIIEVGLVKHESKLLQIFADWGVDDVADLKEMFVHDPETCEKDLKPLWMIKFKNFLGLVPPNGKSSDFYCFVRLFRNVVFVFFSH